MAFELRCPECRTKLRLKTAPEAGTEVECPKCGVVFNAPEPEDGDEETAAKEEVVKELKKAKDKEEKGDKTEKKAEKKDGKKDAKGDAKTTPKKRKAKKKKTSKASLIAVLSIGAVMLISMTVVLVRFFTRTSQAVEMFYYAPEDAQFARGMNLGHAQKYPAFYKSFASLLDGFDYKVAGDAIAKAAGTEMDAMMDYVAEARSRKNGSSIIFRTKTEFDSSALAKIPGAAKKTLDGQTYYVVPNLLANNQAGLVFAPTPRLIVICPANMENQPEFRKILAGHADSKEKTLGIRMGALGKRVTRGTFWQMTIYDDQEKPPEAPASNSGGNNQGGGGTPPAGGGTPPAGGAAPTAPPASPVGPSGGGGGNQEDETKAQRARAKSDGLNGTKGFGVKASLGSREVRFEIVVWHKEGAKASNYSKKMKESELGKGDEGNPPKWFKDDTGALGDKKIASQIISNIGFGSSGELFYVKSSVDTLDLQQSASNVIGLVVGISKQGGGMSPGGAGGAGTPGGQGTPPGPGGGGPPPVPGGPPKTPRRRSYVLKWTCR